MLQSLLQNLNFLIDSLFSLCKVKVFVGNKELKIVACSFKKQQDIILGDKVFAYGHNVLSLWNSCMLTVDRMVLFCLIEDDSFRVQDKYKCQTLPPIVT